MVAKPTDLLVVDVETLSEVDLAEVGAWRYSMDPTTGVYCMAYGFSIDDVKLWTYLDTGCPSLVRSHIERGGLIEAFNVFFEMSIWANILVPRCGWPIVPDDQWRCSQARAYSFGMAGGNLGQISKFLGLSETKDAKGHELMLTMCKPRKPTKKDPRRWINDTDSLSRLYEYCIQDVKTEIALSDYLPELSADELAVWQADQQINLRGIKCDVPLARAALDLFNEYKDKADQRVYAITNGAVEKLTQVERIKTWAGSLGWPQASFDKDAVTKLLSDPLAPKILKEVARLRSECGRNSVAKFGKMAVQSDPNDTRLRGLLNYHGAGTGRWTSYGVQLQNLISILLFDEISLGLITDRVRARDLETLELIGHPVEALMACLRGALIAAPGKKFIDVDYVGIEMRLLAWFASEDWVLDAVRAGRDVYCMTASELMGRAITKKDKLERTIGKVTELSSGYGIGGPALHGRFDSWGLDLDLDFAKKAVGVYRATHPKIKKLWYDSQRAATNAITNPETWQPTAGGKIGYYSDRDRLFCRLPSGRNLVYWHPRIEQVPAPWDPDQIIDQIMYDQFDRPTKLYGGKHVENYTQATARDLLADALVRLEAAGYTAVLSAHDEGLWEVPEGVSKEEIEEIIMMTPSWANGCPIDVEGWEGPRFKKG